MLLQYMYTGRVRIHSRASGIQVELPLAAALCECCTLQRCCPQALAIAARYAVSDLMVRPVVNHPRRVYTLRVQAVAEAGLIREHVTVQCAAEVCRLAEVRRVCAYRLM